jgi:uncharacterized protein YecE (DUF72 family)
LATYWIGTSGWNYKHWKGLFYPEDLPQKRWFDHYARHFRTVEINNSFYREPAAKTYDGWRNAAPEGFCFAVKAHRFLTHRKLLIDPEDPLERIVKGARRLEHHLGPILYQMPPNFRRSGDRPERLEAFLRILPPDLEHVMEFRDKSWWTEETLDQLRAHAVAFCWHDFGGADVPLAATVRFAYLRFHGGGQKYYGNYPYDALEEYARRIRELAREVDDIYIYFNNDIGGHAVTNAQTMAGLLHAPMPVYA